MKAYPPMSLSRLRDIGWTEWDPIGLLAKGDQWDRRPFADEYDTYLLHVAGAFRRGATLSQAIDYLVDIEQNYIGLGVGPAQKERADATARAMQKYVVELDGFGPSTA